MTGIDDFFKGVEAVEQDEAEYRAPNSIFDYTLPFDLQKFWRRVNGGYKIIDKRTSALLRFGPLLRRNRPQMAVLQKLLEGLQEGGPQRFIILKSRKVGISTIMGILFPEIALQMPEFTCAVIAHTDPASKVLFSISRSAIEMLPKDLKLPIRYNSEDRIEFGEASRATRNLGEEGIGHRSVLKTETAAGRYPLSGDTVRFLHLSECAKYDSVGDIDAQERFILSAMGAVPKNGPSLVVAESTANGKQGWFYKTWQAAGKAQADQTGIRWKRIFIPWHKDPDCMLPVPARYDWSRWPSEDLLREKDLRENFAVSDEQLMFRRAVLNSDLGGDIDKWDQEFPESAEVAFTAGGNSFIPSKNVRRMGRYTATFKNELDLGDEPNLLRNVETVVENAHETEMKMVY